MRAGPAPPLPPTQARLKEAEASSSRQAAFTRRRVGGAGPARPHCTHSDPPRQSPEPPQARPARSQPRPRSPALPDPPQCPDRGKECRLAGPPSRRGSETLWVRPTGYCRRRHRRRRHHHHRRRRRRRRRYHRRRVSRAGRPSRSRATACVRACMCGCVRVRVRMLVRMCVARAASARVMQGEGGYGTRATRRTPPPPSAQAAATSASSACGCVALRVRDRVHSERSECGRERRLFCARAIASAGGEQTVGE